MDSNLTDPKFTLPGTKDVKLNEFQIWILSGKCLKIGFVPIIVAIVTALAPLLATTILSDVYNKPVIGFRITEHNNTGVAVIEMTNNGTLGHRSFNHDQCRQSAN